MPDPTAPQIFALALQHHQAGRLTEAEALYRQVLALQPGHADAWHFLGIIAQQAGRHDLAIELIRKAVALNPSHPAAHSNLGEAYRSTGRLDEAIASYNRAIQLKTDYAEAYNNRGIALADQRRFDEALADGRRALELKPDYPEAWNNLGIALEGQARPEEAMAAYRRALELKPAFAGAETNLGNVVRDQGRWEEAANCYRRALVLNPHSAEAHLNLGVNFWLQADFSEAEACYRKALVCRPDYADAHLNLGLLLLLLGRSEEGWGEYEWRWRSSQFIGTARNFSQPQWDGTPVPGRTILIHAEQGLGDTLQFARYLPIALRHSEAARVILECPPPLFRLFEQFHRPKIEVIARGELEDALPPFDFHLPLLSLPWSLRRFALVPLDTPNLDLEESYRARWRARLDSGARLRVGIVWAGNPAHVQDCRRSLAPDELAPILDVTGVQFVSLQVEPRGSLPACLAAAGVLDFTNEIGDFADSAALVAELDLIITVDTAMAHLAGALGRPVWVLLPLVPDWRWGLGREDTPWYPTMRLFRQSSAGHWGEVLELVATALRERCHSSFSGGSNECPR